MAPLPTTTVATVVTAHQQEPEKEACDRLQVLPHRLPEDSNLQVTVLLRMFVLVSHHTEVQNNMLRMIAEHQHDCNSASWQAGRLAQSISITKQGHLPCSDKSKSHVTLCRSPSQHS